MGEYGGDPIAKLKARELDLRAMDDLQNVNKKKKRLIWKNLNN